ncbi:hypothetical protein EV368DRAFT_65149 [Lentinula lateritia]|nr:hypothetical protein EV368DRAFT_65149 [Lentinula lateritia]
MFARVFVLFAGLPVILGLTLDTPTNVTSGLVSNVTWTATDDDPTFSLELNHPSFSSSLALANNVDPTSGSPLSIEWPIVPADSDYTLSAVNISNINTVFSSSASFSIAQAPTTGVSATVSTTFTTGLSSSGAVLAPLLLPLVLALPELVHQALVPPPPRAQAYERLVRNSPTVLGACTRQFLAEPTTPQIELADKLSGFRPESLCSIWRLHNFVPTSGDTFNFVGRVQSYFYSFPFNIPSIARNLNAEIERAERSQALYLPSSSAKPIYLLEQGYWLESALQ